jgi:hypothetical protein
MKICLHVRFQKLFGGHAHLKGFVEHAGLKGLVEHVEHSLDILLKFEVINTELLLLLHRIGRLFQLDHFESL